jgi:hypothetical protein
MNFDEKNNSKTPGNTLHDLDTMYLSAEKQRIKDAILRTDTDKFFLFTRMLRINSMLKNAKVAHKNL